MTVREECWMDVRSHSLLIMFCYPEIASVQV
jgi:hypothetical protein